MVDGFSSYLQCRHYSNKFAKAGDFQTSPKAKIFALRDIRSAPLIKFSYFLLNSVGNANERVIW